MPKTNSASKSVHSYRLSQEGFNQLRTMAGVMGRSESDVIEVALDRMYREEIRFNRVLRDAADPDNIYHVDIQKEGENENNLTDP